MASFLVLLTLLRYFQRREESLTLTISRLCFRAARHLNQALTSRVIVGNISASILVKNRKQGHSGTPVYFILWGSNQALT